MDLYFLRHGPAASIEEAGVARDADRPLTEDGAALCVRVGAGLRRLGVRFEVIAASPVKRARQTADAVAEGLGARDRVAVTETLRPGCTLMAVADFMRSHRHAEHVVLIGHEPDMSALVSELIGGGTVKMKKAALARVTTDEVAPGAGVLFALVEAQILAQVGVASDVD